MEAIDGLSSETIILQVQDYWLLWDKAQCDYKTRPKAVTWNNISESVELPGLTENMVMSENVWCAPLSFGQYIYKIWLEIT